ncbi:hypothetical protein NP188_24415, partial [Salmonella enterica]|nr:hypothetical protein [Salmonella enterica]
SGNCMAYFAQFSWVTGSGTVGSLRVLSRVLSILLSATPGPAEFKTAFPHTVHHQPTLFIN